MLEIRVFGASDSIGKSCVMISDNDRRIVLDAGIQLHPRKTGLLSTPPEGIDNFITEVDSVLLSHAHIDHSAYIPALYRANYKGEVHMTTPTKDIVRVLWKDHLKIEGPHHYGISHLHEALDNVKQHKYYRKFKVTNGITAEFYDASHILGSSAILIDWDGTRIFYSGDFNDAKTPYHDPMTYPDPDESIDILLVETTNASKKMVNRKLVTSELTKSLLKCYSRGGKAIIPSFALGRSQEIQAYLASDFDSFLKKFPLYIDGMILEMNEIYRNYMTKDWVSPRILIELKEKGLKSPFEHEGIKTIDEVSFSGKRGQKRLKLGTQEKTGIILTTSGMLEGGPVYDYLRYSGHNPSNGLYLVGYQVEGTTGYEILAGQRELTLENGFGKKFEVSLALEIKQFAFSGHSSLEGLVRLVQYTSPSKIYTMHGEPESQENFARTIRTLDYEADILITNDLLPQYP